MPLLFVAHWTRSLPRAALRWPDLAACLRYPAAYLAYALLRGALTGLWPYPFIDASALGFARVSWNVIGLFTAFAAVATLLIGVNRRAG